MYGSGLAEEIVGEAIAGRRDEVFLVSKVLPQNASRGGTIEACERSLGRLRTDRLECYLLHWRGQHPLENTFAAFDQLQHQGKIACWGVSNFDVADLDEAWTIVGAGQLVCNQVLYHLEERAIEHAVILWCEKNGVAVVAYSPYGHGHFPIGMPQEEHYHWFTGAGMAHGLRLRSGKAKWYRNRLPPNQAAGYVRMPEQQSTFRRQRRALRRNQLFSMSISVRYEHLLHKVWPEISPRRHGTASIRHMTRRLSMGFFRSVAARPAPDSHPWA
jgi:hypothetical protein